MQEKSSSAKNRDSAEERPTERHLGELYDAEYYATHFGEIPYDRNAHWLGFFGGIADQIIRSLNPRRVFDAGCAMGFLVEAFWDRGREAWGVDISPYAISKVRPDMRPYCRVGSLTEPIEGEFDLISCIEILEHMHPDDAWLALKNITQATDTILFSSSPSDFSEPTHVNVQPIICWLRLFGQFGFGPDLLFDPSFVSPHAMLLRRRSEGFPEEVLTHYSEMVRYRIGVIERDTRIAGLSQNVDSLTSQREQLTQEHASLKKTLQSLRSEWEPKHDLIRRDRDTAREEVRRLSEQLESLGKENSNLLKKVGDAREEVRRLSDQLGVTSKENNRLLADISELGQQRDAAKRQLAEVFASPGWRLILKYRNVLHRYVFTRPWMHRPYEQILTWLLRAAGLRRNDSHTKSASRAAQNRESASEPGSQSVPSASEDTGYCRWISENEPDPAELARQRREAASLSYRPKISVIVPVFRVSNSVLKQCVYSVLQQTYDHWELCIVDSCPEATHNRSFLLEVASQDSRVKASFQDVNLGLSMNSNAALKLATGEFVALLDHDDTLAPFALYEVVRLLERRRNTDLVYSDHDYISEEASNRFSPLFKPDWSPEIMLSANYITHLTVIRRRIIEEVGAFDPVTDGAQDWDLYFRIVEQTDRIAHIPKVLYHWRVHPSSTALNPSAKENIPQVQTEAIQRHFDRTQLRAVANVKAEGLLHVRWDIQTDKKVSIIIPSKDKVALLSRCIHSICNLTQYNNYEIIVVDNGSTEEGTESYYQKLLQLPNAQVLRYPYSFNYGAMNNLGAQKAHGDLLLFLNNDVEALEPDWLDELVGWAQQDAIGVVGAKLLYPDGTIQHGGVVIGLEGFAGHAFAGQQEMTFSLFGSTEWYRNYLAVTGACMMVRRDIFEAIGGFDETFTSCGSDVEICLRVCRAGYRVVYNPFARLIHHEASTRRSDVPLQDYFVSFKHYRRYLMTGDPYWSPSLSTGGRTITFRNQDEPSSLQVVKTFLEEQRPAVRALSLDSEEARLVSWFDFSKKEVAFSKKRSSVIQGYNRVRKVLWFIPSFENPFYGGIHTILRFAEGWRRQQSIMSHFVVCGGVDDKDEVVDRIRAVYPSCENSDVSILAEAAGAVNLPEADACIATLWTTAYFCLRYDKPCRKFYFIQDYEPRFYRAGSISALVESTYRFGFYGIANTISLKQMYEKEYGNRALYFTPCVDLSIFHPRPSATDGAQPRHGILQIFCYGRPEHPRNAFELMTAALRRVKTRLGERVQIVSAGANWRPEDYDLDTVLENRGMLGYQETSELYRSSDVGVVLMLTRHPSYIPLELMASGCLVITNRNSWTEWLLHNGSNCLLSDLSASQLAETVEEGLMDVTLRQRITKAAEELVRHQYSDWEPQIAKVCEFLHDPETVLDDSAERCVENKRSHFAVSASGPQD